MSAKMFKVGDEIDCIITEIDKDKRRVAISHRLTKENPSKFLKKGFLLTQLLKDIVNKNESLF